MNKEIVQLPGGFVRPLLLERLFIGYSYYHSLSNRGWALTRKRAIKKALKNRGY